MENLPKAVCFDLDGVLVDATEWHFQAFNEAIGLFGHQIERDDHIKIYNGLPSREKLKIMAKNGIVPEGVHDVILEQKKIITNRLIAINCRPKYDKILMLKWLKSKGVKLACCSNAIQESVETMLKLSMLYDYFDLIMGNDYHSGVEIKPKPAPDIYYSAFIELFGIFDGHGHGKLSVDPAQEILIIEDSEHGYQSGVASGARVIRVSGHEEVNLSLFI